MPSPPPATARRHVAVCPFPFASHPATLLLLTRKIAARAPSVHFSFFTTALPASVGSPEVDNVRVRLIGDGPAKVEGVGHPGERLGRFVEAAEEVYKAAMKEAEEEVGVGIGCVVTDALLAAVCGGIAEERAVRWVALWTSGASSLAAHMNTDVLRAKFGRGIESHTQETADKYILGFPTIPIIDLPCDIVQGNLSSPGARLLHRMSLTLPKAAAVAVNSFRRLEPATSSALDSLFHQTLHIGPFPLTLSSDPKPDPKTDPENDPHGCIPWLDRHLASSGPASVAYISFGTALSPPKDELQALANALHASRVPFLWARPDGPDLGKLGPWAGPNGPEIGKVVPWAPQMRVLGHGAVGAHVTHCGWNSVLESLVAGVPMVCRPFEFAEQMLNKGLVERVWRVGVAVEGGRLTEDAAKEAVVEVVAGEEGRIMRERIGEVMRVAQEDGARTSALDFEKLVTIVTS